MKEIKDMPVNTMIKELLDEKERQDNTVDLDAYANGLEDMLKAMKNLVENIKCHKCGSTNSSYYGDGEHRTYFCWDCKTELTI
jgi:hypothetical protein